MSRHLVTGATGFIGGAIVLELLSATDDEVLCVVRAPDVASARQRLHASLEAAAAAYDRPELICAIRERCLALPGDVTEPRAGADPRLAGRCAEVWHAAASLKYLDRHAKEIVATNVHGTRNVLQLAVEAGAETFNHVSTAYVAGRRTGLVLEVPVDPETPTNNRYERSKIDAEWLVLGEDRLRPHILRPAIVIGHSRNMAAFSSFGFYGAFAPVSAFRDRVQRRLGAYMTHYRTQVRADPQSEMNAIPVDFVARNAVRISRSGSAGTVFHLTNAAAPTVGDGVTAVFLGLGMRAPELVASSASFTSLDRALDRGIDFFASYMKSSKTFDRTNADAACGRDAFVYPLTLEALTEFGRWYLEHQGPRRPVARRASGAAVPGTGG